ncbi:MAG: ATP-grasp domain-containing protein [Candidatus Hodarchaeales archaeon]
MEKINVLIFPAGEINSVELHNALSSCLNINLFGASSIDRHGPYIFKKYFSDLPLISEKGFINQLNELIDKFSIDLVIPTHDTVALYFAENKEKLATKVLTPDYKTLKICRHKQEMYAFFKDCDFIPNIFRINSNLTFPIFIKPDEGQGGKGAKLIISRAELDSIKEIQNYVISEYLPGDELTVDCITDYKGNLRGVFPRLRERIFCGVSVAGKALNPTPEVKKIAQMINERLRFLGLWFFQLKKNGHGKYKLLEISSRCAGGMCLTRSRGVNLPLLSVYTAMGFEIEVQCNKYEIKMDRTLINRYKTDISYRHLYLDFDDTLVYDNSVNLDIIRLIYQCLNKGKKIHLITKHNQDIYSTLEHYHISKDLFSEIIHIPVDFEKYKYITHLDAIFIDNSYRERKSVLLNCGIPVFDVDAIEVLLDWRK